MALATAVLKALLMTALSGKAWIKLHLREVFLFIALPRFDEFVPHFGNRINPRVK